MRRFLLPLLGLLLAPAALPSPAAAASSFYIRGAGFGHGIGMSQYGAYGYALHGRDYKWILRHYYSHTALGTLPSSRRARVILQQRGNVTFSGASSAGGRRLDPHRRYSANVSGGQISIGGVGRLGRSAGVHGPSVLRLGGTAINGISNGRYRGALELIARGGSVAVDNVVGLDDYVRGVVAGEMPSSWSSEALRAQAVAARTYAITVGGSGELYPDTRSQVYNGVAGEASRSDAAVRATRGQVVTYKGSPVVTYFTSTSGGRTANIEESFIGSTPSPWLRSVVDQYDSVSPYHRWGTYTMSLGRAAAKLAGYVRGSFRGVQVTRRGGSPRVVSAYVLGSRGRTRISGPTLKYRFGLYDTWAYFLVASHKPPRNFGEPRHSSAGGGSTTPPPATTPPAPSGGAGTGSGGTGVDTSVGTTGSATGSGGGAIAP
jgi:stage II sporulation protein D